MSEATESQYEDLPGFAPPPSPPVGEIDPQDLPAPSPSPDRPTISDPHPESPSGDARKRPTSSGSSATSSDEIDEALAGYGAAAFMLASAAVNKLAESRTKKRTSRWLATEDETERFGTALGRIAGRRVPDELTGNKDAADYLVMGEVVLTYGARTLLNLSPEEAAEQGERYLEAQAVQQAAAAQQQAQVAQNPQYAAPPPTAPPQRSVVSATDVDGEAGAAGAPGTAPAMPPLSVITPGI